MENNPKLQMSVDDVVGLLTKLDLGDLYADIVKRNKIDGKKLTSLTETDFDNLGFLPSHAKIISSHFDPSAVTHSSDDEKRVTKPDWSKATDGTAVIADDPWLEPYAQVLRDRFSTFSWWKAEIASKEGSLAAFAEGYKIFGFHKVKGGIMYRDWAPGAHQLFVTGEFNNWQWHSHPCKREEHGKWSCFFPDLEDGTPLIQHGSKVKIVVRGERGESLHISPWMRYVTQDAGNPVFDGVYWDPPEDYVWKHPRPPKVTRPRIYECHIGMSGEEERIATYKEFSEKRLPYIKDMGYNCIQIMAIMEHSYYASFGYQVTSFFAPSSRFGTPDDLKELIDHAHKLGLYVLLDVVHSHASKNVADGLNFFDGTDGAYFHRGMKGVHPIWDSRLFNYDSWEVMRFLLSNLRWWIEEYHFDGFRFDGVTTMILNNRAVGDLPSSYDSYMGPICDGDALRYLTLANDLLHELYPWIITIAEEASGFPTMCRPTSEGGVGFDYRLAMGMPDFWKKMMLISDSHWEMGKMAYELTNRRWKEANIAYVECHDQALVGDKTMAFWLMDAEMYTGMSILSPPSLVIDRGIQLHKLIRLVTFGLGGEGYLTFMGNEFGHPEWIDFPREGNNHSFHYCCRRWHLPADPLLRYQHLQNFEKAMLHLEEKYPWLDKGQYISVKHEGDKVLIFERGPLLFAFNFHPTQSFPSYRIPVLEAGKYEIVLDSDLATFGGHGRNAAEAFFFTEPYQFESRPNSMLVYLPSRCALVYHKVPESAH